MASAEKIDPRFAALYAAHFGWVWGVLARFGVHGQHREDLAQEVWITVHRRLDTLDPAASERGWLFAITRRVVALHHRTRSRAQRRLGALRAVPLTETPTPADRAEARQLVDQLLGDLAPPQREVLTLACMGGLTGPEIADVLGLPLNTVYSRLRLARRRAGEELARILPADEPPVGAERRCWAGLLPLLPEPPGRETTLWGALIKPLGAAAVLGAASVAVAVFWGPSAEARPALVRGALQSLPSFDDAPASPATDPIPVAEPTDTPPATVPPPAAALDALTEAASATYDARAPGGWRDRGARTRRARRARLHADRERKAAPPARDLAEENRLLEPAVRAVARGEARVALRHAAVHAARFPDGLLRETRVATRVRALCQLGEVDLARRAAGVSASSRPSLPLRRALEDCD